MAACLPPLPVQEKIFYQILLSFRIVPLNKETKVFLKIICRLCLSLKGHWTPCFAWVQCPLDPTAVFSRLSETLSYKSFKDFLAGCIFLVLLLIWPLALVWSAEATLSIKFLILMLKSRQFSKH